MGFVCTAARQTYHFDVFRRGDSYAITFPVGYDDTEDLNYFAMIGLESMPPGELEYYFCLLRIDGVNKTEQTIWSGRDLPRGISETDRRAILAVILMATASLLSSVRPERVFRCTHDTNMPDKALEKHHEISQIFTRCGYRVQTADTYHGKRTWWMEREIDSDRFDSAG
jgi:hypothetical protein